MRENAPSANSHIVVTGDNGGVADSGFRRDLFRGTARYYDEFRVPYPRGLIDDLAARVGEGGRLLDLACGTGQISFALHARYREVWAVDQEPEMIAVVRQKAEAAGIGNIRPLTAAAEDLEAPGQSFDLAAVGNAFHRLPRDLVAARVLRWLRPGGCLALVWGDSPWSGEEPWQRALASTMKRWRARADGGRLPAGYERDRRERPDLAVLREAGFHVVGSHQFTAAYEWTPDTLAGFLFSTSVLSRPALGDRAAGFEEDLRREMLACAPAGRWRQDISFGYQLARRPAKGPAEVEHTSDLRAAPTGEPSELAITCSIHAATRLPWRRTV
jgi:SAM-dependent methyltransferase